LTPLSSIAPCTPLGEVMVRLPGPETTPAKFQSKSLPMMVPLPASEIGRADPTAIGVPLRSSVPVLPGAPRVIEPGLVPSSAAGIRVAGIRDGQGAAARHRQRAGAAEEVAIGLRRAGGNRHGLGPCRSGDQDCRDPAEADGRERGAARPRCPCSARPARRRSRSPGNKRKQSILIAHYIQKLR
jgi:hypothetical protein